MDQFNFNNGYNGFQGYNINPSQQQLSAQELEYLTLLQQQQQAQILEYQQQQAMQEQLQQQQMYHDQQIYQEAEPYQPVRDLSWDPNTILPTVSQEQIYQNSLQAQNIANLVIASQQQVPSQPIAPQYIAQNPQYIQEEPQYVQQAPQYIQQVATSRPAIPTPYIQNEELHYMFPQIQEQPNQMFPSYDSVERPDPLLPTVRYNGEMAAMIRGPGEGLEEPGVMTNMDYVYLLFAFIVFSVSVAVVRRQFSNLTNKTNIKKAVKSRFNDVFGKSNGNNQGRNNEMGQDSNDDKLIFGQGDNEAGPSGNKKKITYTNKDKPSIASGINYLQTSVNKVMGKQSKDKNSDNEDDNGDPYEYEVLDSYNKQEDRRVNFNAEQGKNLWSKDGLKAVDENGNEIKKKEESKTNDIFDGSREGDDKESPVALLSAMDLNCDDDKINTLVYDNPETGSRGSTASDSSQSKKTDIGTSILKKLNINKKPTKKAALVEDDEDENEAQADEDVKGAKDLATDLATINNVVDELNDLMKYASKETEPQAFMKIDDNL